MNFITDDFEPRPNTLTDPTLGCRICLTLMGLGGAPGRVVAWSVLLLPIEWAFPLCQASNFLNSVGQEACPAQMWTDGYWEAPSLALIIPHSAPVGVMLLFAFQNLYLPTSSLNKSQLHLCPKLQVAWLSLDFYPVWGREELLP